MDERIIEKEYAFVRNFQLQITHFSQIGSCQTDSKEGFWKKMPHEMKIVCETPLFGQND